MNANELNQKDFSLHNGNGLNPKHNHHISDRIAEVIQKRQKLAEKVKPVELHLQTLLQEIESLNQHRQILQTNLDNYDARESLNKINLTSIEENIRLEIEQLRLLQQRFSRSTLNIGVVGWTGQGKSTFLKSLSGLSDDIIPARKGGACTAVRSKIEHHDGETQAIVTLYSENSFIAEVIKPYYEKLSLGTPPKNLDEFAHLPFPNPPEGVTNQAMYEHLRDDYYLPLENYRPLLKSGEPRDIRITEAEISKYVVQKRDEKNRLTTFSHLAVRDVHILCRFPKTEVERLALIDVPGLGDTRLGDEDLMLETLGQEVDIVLFLKKPDEDRFLWKKEDTTLYDITSQVLPDFGDRAFLVLNHKPEGKNFDGCRWLRDNVGKMTFVSREIANCANPDEANRILELILQYLNQHIQTIEQRYAQFRQNSLIALHQTIQTELSQAEYAIRKLTEENKLFRKLFEELMQNLTNGLRDLLETLKEEQHTVDTNFEAVVNAALTACENNIGIPSEEEIRNRARSTNLKDSYRSTYGVLIVELRAHLSQNFLTLDEGLQQSANQLKERIAEILIEKAGLGKICDRKGVEFLDKITEILAKEGNALELGFRTLSHFNISYGALILRLIRQNLMSVLEPDEIIKNHELREAAAYTAKVIAEAGAAVGVASTTEMSPELIGRVVETSDRLANKVLESVFEFNPSKVRENLQQLHQQAINKCKETLERWLTAPSEIRYYMATEFVDRVLDAHEMKSEWDNFLRDDEIRSKIWIEFSNIEKMKRVQQNWQDALQKVLQLNQRSQFEFIH
ncbi:hypothetical protein F7734_36045 [Scytonema sp. UIC 10036]|uniref:dynamin family protein n=1 Tax=Scytonema sp. UIC 10036 TaxID=2304196 RepID=UPI0012DAE518|nr:dynamin family protein [Scytonema sp. UIC 10036]MUG97450.1 hypothetical protein [Scytonema sp. UIC 10036]